MDWLVDSGELGKVELEVKPEGEKPVFVGIAPTEDVTSYLRNVDHSLVTEVDAFPLEASYQRESGERRPAAPARAVLLDCLHAGSRHPDARLAHGRGRVVGRGDERRRLAQRGRRHQRRAKLPFLDELGWIATGGGGAMAIGALALIVLGLRPPRNRPPQVQVGGVAPAAA